MTLQSELDFSPETIVIVEHFVADLLSQQLATGQISDLSQVTAAAAKAELAIELTVAFRDRAVQSFQQIMQMQI